MSFDIAPPRSQYGWPCRVTGTMVNYYHVCHRRLWLLTHNITQEQSSELVALGRLIHESSFVREHKEVMVFNRIRIDHTTTGQHLIVHEVKKSGAMSVAARVQLLFYLYELERLGIDCTGELHFRSERRKQPVVLDDEGRRTVEAAVREICRIVGQSTPPPRPAHAPCKKCAYRDYCEV